MQYLVIFLSLFSFTGCCLLPGDGTFRVIGSVEDDTNCKIELYTKNGEKVSQSEVINGNFKTTFIVGGCKKEYQLKCICSGKVVKETKVQYGEDALYDPPYDIGKIQP